ncbi:TPA: hypothetical protein ACHGKH_004077, partial [Escherichia coli]
MSLVAQKHRPQRSRRLLRCFSEAHFCKALWFLICAGRGAEIKKPAGADLKKSQLWGSWQKSKRADRIFKTINVLPLR